MVNRAVADEIADLVLTDEILTDSEAHEDPDAEADFWQAHRDQITDDAEREAGAV